MVHRVAESDATEVTVHKRNKAAVPGASTGDATHDKVMRRGLMGKASQASGVRLGFPEHLPPKTRVCLPYCTVLSILLPLKGINLGLQLTVSCI